MTARPPPSGSGSEGSHEETPPTTSPLSFMDQTWVVDNSYGGCSSVSLYCMSSPPRFRVGNVYRPARVVNAHGESRTTFRPPPLPIQVERLPHRAHTPAMVRRRQDQRGLTTLLFTDIVGSSEVATELGDR